MEFEGEEFSVFEKFQIETKWSYRKEEVIEDRPNRRPLKEFADRQNLKMPTLRKIIYLLTEQGSSLNRLYPLFLMDPFQENFFLILAQFEEEDRSYQKQLSDDCSSWARTRAKGKLTAGSGADRSFSRPW